MTAPAGAVVRIYYDGLPIERGEVLRTPTGRCYVILEKRVQARGAHVGRQHLACLVADEPPPGPKVRGLRWYKRTRRKARCRT